MCYNPRHLVTFGGLERKHLLSSQGARLMERDHTDGPAAAVGSDGTLHYILVLARYWRYLIALMLVVVGLVAAPFLVYRAASPAPFEAASEVVIARVTSDIKFEERYLTETPLDLSALTSATRRNSLVQLVDSTTIAEQIITEFGDRLPEVLRVPAELLRNVKGEIATERNAQADILYITVATPDATLSYEIANRWAEIYVEQVNAIYGQVPGELIAAVEADAARADEGLRAAQAALEQALGASQRDQLAIRLANAEIAMQAALVQLDLNRRSLLAIRDVRLAAEGLRTQLAAPNGDLVSTQIALIALTERAGRAVAIPTTTEPQFAPANPGTVSSPLVAPIAGQSGVSLQLVLDAQSGVVAPLAAQRAAVAALLTALDARITVLNQAIVDADAAIASGTFPGDPTMEGPWRTIGALRAAYEAADAELARLTEARDLAQTTATTVNNKVAELRLARTAANSEVRLGSPAFIPDERSTEIRLLLILAIGAMLGAILAVIELALARLLQRAPFDCTGARTWSGCSASWGARHRL